MTRECHRDDLHSSFPSQVFFRETAACKWRKSSQELFRDVLVLMRDTGMRNERELYRMRIENLHWENRLIYVPDSKTLEGRRLIPMSNRVAAVLRQRSALGRRAGCFRPNTPPPGIRPQSATGFARPAERPVYRRTWYFIVRDTTTALGFSCELETWLPS